MEISRDSNRFDFNEKRRMNEHQRSTWHSSFSSPVSTICSKEFENFYQQTSVQHSFTDNNHSIPSDQTSFQRQQRRQRHHQSNKSLILIFINRILLTLLRLMILFLIILFITWTFYSTIISIYFKPKKSIWQEIIHWLYQDN